MKHLIVAFLALGIVACNLGGSKNLKEQNDSLMVSSMEKDKQLNNLLNAMMEIDDNLNQIKEREDIISLNISNNEAGGPSLEEKISGDIQLIYNLMTENKEKIDKLEEQLKQSGSSNTNLKKVVNRLNQQMKEKTLEIVRLNQILEEKNLEIVKLNFTVDDLKGTVDSLNITNEKTQQQLHQAYYVFGTKKELKEQSIISNEGFLNIQKKVLSADFSKEYFTPIDTREVESIDLFRTKAKVLTNHPEDSYELKAGEEGALTLVITDKDKFWSISKHLVVQVN